MNRLFKSFVCAVFICEALLFNFNIVYAGATDLSVTERQLVNKVRASRAHFDYTYTIKVANTSIPLNNVIATVTSLSVHTVIIEGTVNFANLGSGTVQSTDTFTIRQNRRRRFNPNDLVWSFTADEPEPTNTAPTANAGSDVSSIIGQSISLDGLGSSDPEDDTLAFLWSLSTPTGSSASLTGSASATPQFTPDIAGIYTATLIVNDSEFDSLPDSVVITVVFSGDNPPDITSTPSLSGSENQSYSYDVNATDPDAGDTLTYQLLQAPAGMTINAATGLISWLPDSTGAVDVDVQVTDSTGLTDRQIYLLTINGGEGDLPPTLSAIANQTTVVGNSLMLTALGSDPEGEVLRYNLIAAPAGMAINSTTGVLQWTPGVQQIGSTTATVSVTDPGGQQAQSSFNVIVLTETINNAPVIDPVSNQSVDALTSIQLVLNASDTDGDDELRFTLSGAPDGLQFDERSGAISWTPGTDDIGTVNLTATVTDSAGAAASTSFNITVLELPRAPVAVDDAYTVRERGVLSVGTPGVLANDTDGNGDVLSSVATTGPMLGTLNTFAVEGSFTYTPPPIPPIEIGLVEQCRTIIDGGNATAHSISVADMDGDGDLELVSWARPRTISLYNATTCELESRVTLASKFGLIDSAVPVTLVNLDNDPELELVTTYAGGNTLIPGNPAAGQFRLMAFNIDGTPVWNSTGVSEAPVTGTSGNSHFNVSPSAVDLDGDGKTELILATNGVSSFTSTRVIVVAYNGQTGQILWEYVGPLQGGQVSARGDHWAIADIDLDGTIEIIFGGQVIDHEGNLEFTLPNAGSSTFPQFKKVAIANFDTDPFPELLAVDGDGHTLYEHTGAVKWHIPRPTGGEHETTIAELDGDNQPEYVRIELPNGDNGLSRLVAYDSDGTLLWTHKDTPFQLTNSTARRLATVPVAFDFDRDGIDELVIHLNFLAAAEVPRGLHIFDGSDGSEIAFVEREQESSGGFNFQTLTIADVDGDGAAEILVREGFQNAAVIRVLEGTPGNPFPPARKIRNQGFYHPTQVNEDGSIPTSVKPHWLIPGLNKYNASAVIPGENESSSDAFNYVANDGSSDSNEATVSITIATVNAPNILSNPPLGGSPGFVFNYPALASDADFGDTLTWSLVDAPAGMTVDSFGIVSWIPTSSDLGVQRVQLVVTDSQGNSDSQVYQIIVTPPVTVPDIIGDTEINAGDALVANGLTVGSVTQSFSLIVPAGQVISQSIAGGSLIGAGTFVDYVISLGPQPIFTPDLVALNSSAATALLESLGLNVGAISKANSSSIPVGGVISQSVSPNTLLDLGEGVDLVVSSGPALVAALVNNIVESGNTIGLQVRLFDNTGVEVIPQPAITLSVTAVGNTGSLPTVTVNEVTTQSDTRGAFKLTIDAGSFGTETLPFIVRTGVGPGNYYKAIADFADTISSLPEIYSKLATELSAGNTIAVQSLAAQLVVVRDGLDTELLKRRNPFAPETGFIPTRAEAAVAGFPAGISELEAGRNAYRNAENAINAAQVFFQQLNPAAGGRNDDVRARFLNNQLDANLNALLNTNLSVGAQVNFNTESYVLLSHLIPQLLQANLDAMINLLANDGFIATLKVMDNNRFAALLPEQLYAVEQPVSFTLGGMMSASSIQMGIIKDYYMPLILDLFAVGLELVEADALISKKGVLELTAIITGATQSFHTFKLPNSVVEATGVSRDSRSFTLKVIGPDKYLPWVTFVNGLSKPGSFEDVVDLVDGAFAASAGSLAGTKPGVVHQSISGCLFEQVLECSQLVIGFGFPIVHSTGKFPAPVLVVLEDHTTGAVYASVYSFFPMEP